MALHAVRGEVHGAERSSIGLPDHGASVIHEHLGGIQVIRNIPESPGLVTQTYTACGEQPGQEIPFQGQQGTVLRRLSVPARRLGIVEA